MRTFHFGPYVVPTSEIFFNSRLSVALVNIKPIIPGHVLVAPRRLVPRFKDLTSDEVSDLFASVHLVSGTIEKEYGGESMTITLQDGPQAGQTVPHVHVHIIPRKQGDPWSRGNNDEIYPAIDQSEAGVAAELPKATPPKTVPAGPRVDSEESRQPRTIEDMAQEAGQLRRLFVQYEDMWSS